MKKVRGDRDNKALAFKCGSACIWKMVAGGIAIEDIVYQVALEYVKDRTKVASVLNGLGTKLI